MEYRYSRSSGMGRRDINLLNKGKRGIFLDQSPRQLFHATSGPNPTSYRTGPPNLCFSACLPHPHSWYLCKKILPY